MSNNSIIGTWDVTQQTVLGTSQTVWVVTEANGRLAFEVHGSKMVLTPAGITQTGDQVTFILDMEKPIPARATAQVTVTGDAFDGTIGTKYLPTGKLSGTRQVAQAAPAAPVTEQAAPHQPWPAAPSPAPEPAQPFIPNIPGR